MGTKYAIFRSYISYIIPTDFLGSKILEASLNFFAKCVRSLRRKQILFHLRGVKISDVSIFHISNAYDFLLFIHIKDIKVSKPFSNLISNIIFAPDEYIIHKDDSRGQGNNTALFKEKFMHIS